ncbi:MAG TPA: NfeD family protein [Terriglobia bacterium]|nr:NfeD family protein [Terriglobia bacterium]
MRTFARYLLLQIPGWVLVALLLAALHRWMALPLWAAVVVLVLDVAKDFVLYPYLRRAYETTPSSGTHCLIGKVGVVTKPLNPEGYLRLHGDLWQARVEEGTEAVLPGTRVRVVGADGLVLLVSAERDEARQT